MKIVETKKAAREIIRKWKRRGLRIGLVPTMGYFHEGHLSLMDKCHELADKVAVSLFVNPAQFAPNEDLSSYPRDRERDLALADRHNVDLVFIPGDKEMYAPGHKTWVTVEGLTSEMCGRSRPTHFCGVATVVTKLFNIITPDVAVFGEKDFQQLQVIRRMTHDLDMPVEIVGHPIVREPDGLAMSSRNSYLSKEERRSALCLSQALDLAEHLVKQQGIRNCSDLRQALTEKIEAFPFARIDYIFTGDPETLESKDTINNKLLVALAVFVGATRLIDNRVITLEADTK